MTETYKCIMTIKFKKTKFNLGELVKIHSKNDENYLIGDLNNLKGLSLPVKEFEKYFRKL